MMHTNKGLPGCQKVSYSVIRWILLDENADISR